MVLYSQRIPATDETLWEERLAAAEPASVVVTHVDPHTLAIEAYFSLDTVPLILQAAFGGRVSSVDTAADDGWEALPARIGNRFLVADEPISDAEERTVLWVEAPPTVFAGHRHPTALACLRFAVDLVEEGRLPHKFTCLDAGCGTGILGIAAALLGARKVDGIDLCADAVRCAESNALRHGVTCSSWQSSDIGLFKADTPYDLVFANLFSDLLENSFHSLRLLTASEGYLIVSGILKRFSSRVLTAAREEEWRVIEIRQRGPWVAALLTPM